MLFSIEIKRRAVLSQALQHREERVTPPFCIPMEREGEEEKTSPHRSSSDGCLNPSTKRRTPDHPPYAEMVQVALRSLAEKGGSTESSISSYIQSNYYSLPWGHSNLLPYYLRKLVAAGDISMPSPDRYILPQHPNPNPNPPSPPTSLPRKPKLSHRPTPHCPRRRGRPPLQSPNKPPRRRGHHSILPERPLLASEPVAAAAGTPVPRRGRGRPRRNPNTAVIHNPKPTSDGEPRPRLILHLKRSKPSLPHPGDDLASNADGNAGVWCCLKRESTAEKEPVIVADSKIEERVEELESNRVLLLPHNSQPDEEPSMPAPVVQTEPNEGLLLLPAREDKLPFPSTSKPDQVPSPSEAIEELVTSDMNGVSTDQNRKAKPKKPRKLWFEG